MINHQASKLILLFESCFRYNCNSLLNKFQNGLTWYWARYSWANYAVDLDIPKDTISEALGHKHGSAVTGIYIKYSLDKVDKANRQVIDYLNETPRQASQSDAATKRNKKLLKRRIT